MNALLEGTPLAAIPGAVAAGLVAGTLLPLLGIWVVLQRVVFLGVTLAQIAAAGVALGLVLGWPPLPVGLAATLVVVGAGARYARGQVTRVGDWALGATFCVASALSLLFVSRSPSDLDEVYHVLHGNLIYAAPGDVWLVGAVLVAGALIVELFFKEVLFTAFDGETASALGLPTRRWMLLVFGVLAVVLSVSMRTTGSLLTFAMLVLPPLAAIQLGRGLKATFWLSGALGLVGTLAGLLFAVHADLHVESSITVTLFVLVPICAGWRRQPLLGAALAGLAVVAGLAVTPPAAPAEPGAGHHHHAAGGPVAGEPWHLDVVLDARSDAADATLTVDWTLDVRRAPASDDLPPRVWLVLTGDGLSHEHELVHDLAEAPAGESRHTGTFSVPLEAPVHHLEGQLWTGPTTALEALPLPTSQADVTGCDVGR